jgi:hypothetical protein
MVFSVRDHIDESSQKIALLALRDGICTDPPGTFTDEECKALGAINENDDADEMLSKMKKVGGVWKNLASSIEEKLPVDQQTEFVKILIKNACHEESE